MIFDNGQLPISGGLLMAGAAYAAIFLFGLGPLVGERMIEKMDWAGQCSAHIQAEVESRQPDPVIVPKLGCNELFGVWFGREGAQYCARHGHLLDNNPISRSLESAENAKRETQRRRMEYAAARAGSRCECAVTTTLEKQRISLAVGAGTARLLNPPTFKSLEADLVSSLNAPTCAMKG